MDGMQQRDIPTMTDESYQLLERIIANAIRDMRRLGMSKAHQDRMRSAAAVIPSIITYRKANP
jgi:hypothetical protein